MLSISTDLAMISMWDGEKKKVLRCLIARFFNIFVLAPNKTIKNDEAKVEKNTMECD